MEFDDWLTHCFDQPLSDLDTLDELGIEPMGLPSEESLVHVTRAFESASDAFARFDPAHVNQGLFYLVHPMHGDQMSAVVDLAEPFDARKKCIDAIHPLFARFFAPVLEKSPDSPISDMVARFWEVFPTDGKPGQPAFTETDKAILALMERLLELDSKPCVASTLSGLSMWRSSYRKEVEGILDRFLARDRVDTELLNKARAAKQGTIPP